MDRRITWLRISYWTGAIIDALAAIQMLVPSILATTSGLSDFSPSTDYYYAMGMGASLMVGWTVLLLWADRKPVERKGVLLITLVPVIVGMVVNEIAAVQGQFISAGAMLPVWVLQVVLVALFGFSYWNARGRILRVMSEKQIR